MTREIAAPPSDLVLPRGASWTGRPHWTKLEVDGAKDVRDLRIVIDPKER